MVTLGGLGILCQIYIEHQGPNIEIPDRMCFSADERRQIKLCFKNFKFITVKDTINNNERCWKIYYLSFYISFQIKELVHLKCHFQESSLNKKGRTKW